MNFTRSFSVPTVNAAAAHAFPDSLWFDPALQHALLLEAEASGSELYFYSWSPWNVDVAVSEVQSEDVDYGPRFIYKCPIPQGRIIYAALSIDRGLLAIQTRLSSITVVEIGQSGRSWVIEIKSPSSNEILPNGLVWSDHGGGSQDLAIITSKGVELYKISASRNQCKLSRCVTVRCRFFWYEPNFRCILVADTSSSVLQRQQVLTLNGIILNCDKSTSFKIELPPPEKIPSFSLSPEVRPEAVSLVGMYGRLYCAAYAPGPQSSTVFLYEISKQGVTRKINLLCNFTGAMSHSCFDNLFVCHFLDANKSVAFDIWDCKRSMDGNGETLDFVVPIKQPVDCVALIPPFDIRIFAEDAASSLPEGAPCEPEPELQTALLSDMDFWPASHLVYNKKARMVYGMRCSLGAFEVGLASSSSSSSASRLLLVSFLLRRGQAPSAPRPVRSPDNALGTEAKTMVLTRLYSWFETKVSVSDALSLLLPIVQEYSSTFLSKPEDLVARSDIASSKETPINISSVAINDAMSSAGGSGGNPLEQYVSFQQLRRDVDLAMDALSRRGARNALGRRPSKDDDTERNGPISKYSSLISMSLARSRDGFLVVTQIELLCFVWMPLLLNPECDINYFTRLLTLYQAELKGCAHGKFVPEPIVSLLLFKVLVSTKDEVEVARLMQTQFFSDSSELALECLSLADALASRSSDTDVVANHRKASEQACLMLRQSAMDILWRLGEVVSLTRRMLHEGRVFEAMELCSKRKGMWRTGLSSVTISSDLFYLSLIRYIARLHPSDLPSDEKAQRTAGAMTSVYEFLVDWDPSVLLEGPDVKSPFKSFFSFI
jgi:hypothetical protein